MVLAMKNFSFLVNKNVYVSLCVIYETLCGFFPRTLQMTFLSWVIAIYIITLILSCLIYRCVYCLWCLLCGHSFMFPYAECFPDCHCVAMLPYTHSWPWK